MLIIVLVSFGHSQLGQSCSSVEQDCTIRLENLESSTRRGGAATPYTRALPVCDTPSEVSEDTKI